MAKQLEGAIILPVQEYPVAIKHFRQPVIFPLSHCSVDALIPSPHLAVQVELAPRFPVQVKPESGTQFEEHPVLFPLSHFSSTYNLLLPHIFYKEQA